LCHIYLIAKASLPVFTFHPLICEPNSIIQQRITGALLGDAHLEQKSLTANVRLRYEQTIKHSARFYHLFNMLALMCAGNAVERKRFDSRTGKTYGYLYFTTRSLPILTEFY
jgi:hypothetical protein